jgi:hypothetical protein
MSSSFDPGIVYKKYVNGDSFTDQEIVQGIAHFTQMERDLRSMGPEFKFSANAIMHTRLGLESFLRARNEKMYKK